MHYVFTLKPFQAQQKWFCFTNYYLISPQNYHEPSNELNLFHVDFTKISNIHPLYSLFFIPPVLQILRTTDIDMLYVLYSLNSCWTNSSTIFLGIHCRVLSLRQTYSIIRILYRQ